MCRHVGWLGAPRTLSSLLLEPEHSLRVQSYRPRRQRAGLINADGWGVGFHGEARVEPARWRSNRPLWGDASFASVAPLVSAFCIVGAVRSATVGMPLDETASSPFTSGRWLLSHNGVVDRATLGPHANAESMCDSAVLAAHLFELGAENVAAFVTELGARDTAARLNVLVTDGERMLATRWGDTLCTRRDEDGVVIASEPFDDDPRWVDVPDRHLVEVSAGSLTITPLENP